MLWRSPVKHFISTKKLRGHSWYGMIYLVPVVLSTVSVAELLPLATATRVFAEIDIALEFQHTRRRRAARRLPIEHYIPHSGRTVLRISAT